MNSVLLAIALKIKMAVTTLHLTQRADRIEHFVTFSTKQMLICQEYKTTCGRNEQNIDNYLNRLFIREDTI